MKFKVGFRTDIGMKRKQNQDNGGAFPELGLFVVADGMGGHQGGETASAMVVKLLPEYIAKATAAPQWNPKRVLTEAISEANRTIFRMSQENPKLQGMGTTTTVILMHEEKLTIGHVGDSRCYYFKPNAVWQLTRDHSLVQEKLRAGLINREQAKTDRMKNVITRSVGFEPDVNVEIYEMVISHGDTFLLCSDGLSGFVDDQDTLRIVRENLFDHQEDIDTAIQKTVNGLIDQANANGGEDNSTAIAIQVLAE